MDLVLLMASPAGISFLFFELNKTVNISVSRKISLISLNYKKKKIKNIMKMEENEKTTKV